MGYTASFFTSGAMQKETGKLRTRNVAVASVVLQEWHGICIRKKGASDNIRDASVAFPNTVPHLKRVRPGPSDELYVLLSPAQDDVQLLVSCPENQSGSPNNSRLILFPTGHLPNAIVLPERVCSEILYVFSAYVPVTDPETKQGRDLAASFWPCAFTPLAVHPFPLPVIQGVNGALKCIQGIIRSQEIKGETQQGKKECAQVSCILLENGSPVAYIGGRENEGYNFAQHAVIRMIRDVSAQTEAYLCTKRIAVLSEEPCFVCAAALVHARIGQVFLRATGFADNCQTDNCHANSHSADAPFTVSAIHRNPYLNHRFSVYFVMPRTE